MDDDDVELVVAQRRRITRREDVHMVTVQLGEVREVHRPQLGRHTGAGATKKRRRPPVARGRLSQKPLIYSERTGRSPCIEDGAEGEASFPL